MMKNIRSSIKDEYLIKLFWNVLNFRNLWDTGKFFGQLPSILVLLWKKILVVVENVLPSTWSREAGPEAELYSKHIQREHFILSHNTLKHLCGNTCPLVFIFMKEFKSVSTRQSLSSICILWGSTVAYSKSLCLNKNNALALEGSSLYSWTPVLFFGYKVTLHICLNVELHSSHCKYSHWNQ